MLTNQHGSFDEIFEPVTDPLIQRYLSLRNSTGHVSPVLQPAWWYRLRQKLPFPPNLSRAEFIPTQTLALMEKLRDCFPRHRLVLSDFYHLPDTIATVGGADHSTAPFATSGSGRGAVDAPVVQTRYKRTMVPCSTYLVQQGWFDIFFPTQFELLRDIYPLVCRPEHTPNPQQIKVLSHRDFCQTYGNLEMTTTKSGENPMLDYYENNKFLLT